jgi:amino acid permease
VVADRGATVLGAAGLASIAVGAGMVYLPAGFIVGGVLAVWFASLLPGGEGK